MHTPHQFGIIGSGSWSTALAKMLTDNGYTINWWIRNPDNLALFQKRQHNPHYLTSVAFDLHKIKLSAQLEEVLQASDCLILGMPSSFVQSLIESTAPEQWQGKKIISAIKGILPEEHELLHTWLIKNGYTTEENYFAITGPCHAEEVAAERLSYLTFAGTDVQAAQQIADCFANDYIRVSATHDIWGTQIAAVLKNIYAVGAGIAHGLGYGDNFLSVYITCCYREMNQVLHTLFDSKNNGSHTPDYHTSAYLGDLLVTCYSLHSRNRTFGAMIGKGYSVKAASIEMKMIAEGHMAARGFKTFMEEHKIEAPIANAMYRILWEQEYAEEVFNELEGMFQ